MNIKNRTWQIWVDTGGTFTDCLALDPAGRLHRAKVLSNSALRGTVLEKLDDYTSRIQQQWHAPDDFVTGFRFQILSDKPDGANIVAGFDPANSILTLKNAITKEIRKDAAFEVQSPEEAPVLAARLVTGTSAGELLPALEMRLASTRGTNALLERRGAPTALFITQGFGDLLLIGTQQRPDLFALEIKKPPPFYQTVVEVPERLDAGGNVLIALKIEKLKNEIARIRSQGIRLAAIAFMHSYLNPQHELLLAKYLAKSGFEHISCSSTLAPFIKILPRAETTVIDAYLGPVIHAYLAKVKKSVSNGSLHIMTSAGGLVQSKDFHAKDSLLSGPAGGVVGAAYSARCSGFEKIIAFDMGGTSTDACRFDGDFEYVFEHTVGDAHLVAPALAIESVAAGGGSICWFDGHRLRVGPESAGANPGPACYGAGGPLTITDVNLLLGRLQPDRFEIPINPDLAKRASQNIIYDLEKKTGEKAEKEAMLSGFLEIANERMADAIRSISIRRGYDPAEYALLAFGGAGGQHACAIAELLDIKTVIVPPDASLLSALGIGHARIERFVSRQILQPYDKMHHKLDEVIQELTGQAIASVAKEGVHKNEIEIRRKIIHLRFSGQESSLAIDIDASQSTKNHFLEKYRFVYGYVPDDRPVEVESLRVIASEKEQFAVASREVLLSHNISAGESQRAYFGQGWQEIPVFRREELSAGARFDGPALVFENHSAVVVYPKWLASVDSAGAIVLARK
jgi:5-oxoprolinase (ATP-hydrolysing)